MAVFEIKSDLPIETQKKIDAIEAIPVAVRTANQTAFLTALAPYLTNLIISVGADSLITSASGLTVPTGYPGFRKGAFFTKTDASTNGQYMNVGSTTVSSWDLVDQASTTNIDDKAVTLPKMADMATSSLIYRKTAAAGVPEVNTLATLKTDLGLTNTNSGDQTITLTGNVTGTGTSSFAATLATLPTGTPVNAVASVGTLTLTGVVTEGETVTVGTDVGEIDSDGSVTGGNFAIDVSAVSTASVGTLTATAGGNQIAAGYTVTLGVGAGLKTYTFASPLTPTEGEVLVGATDTASLLNLLNAINYTGTPGTDYSCAAKHTQVEATSSTALTLVVAAKIHGVVGDTYTSTSTGAEISWGAVVLASGVDCTAAGADGLIVSEYNAHKTLAITAAQGAGTTVTFTSNVKGSTGNTFAFSKVITNGSVDGGGFLGGTILGVSGTTGVQWQPMVDATNLYVCIATNTSVDTNWRKLVLQSM